MDEQKMIEEIKAVVRSTCNRQGIAKRCPERIAEAIINAIYGHIEETLKEFVNKLYSQSGIFFNTRRKEKDISVNDVSPYEIETINYECVKVSDIEKTLKEFLGNSESETEKSGN